MIENMIAKLFNRETISYLFFGVLATVVSIGSYYISSRTIINFIGYDEAVMCSNVISWVCAVAFAYITNKIWVFQSKTNGIRDLFREISAFVGARLFSFGFEMAWMYVTAILIGINDTICKFFAQFAIVVMNYVFSKLFIFKNKEKENGLSK